MTEPHGAQEPLGSPGPDEAQPPGMPRWVKITGIVVGLFVLALVAKLVLDGGGGHGPGRHGGLGGAAPAAATSAVWAAASGA